MLAQLGTRPLSLGRLLRSVHLQLRTLAMHLAGRVAVALSSAVAACVSFSRLRMLGQSGVLVIPC